MPVMTSEEPLLRARELGRFLDGAAARSDNANARESSLTVGVAVGLGGEQRS